MFWKAAGKGVGTEMAHFQTLLFFLRWLCSFRFPAYLFAPSRLSITVITCCNFQAFVLLLIESKRKKSGLSTLVSDKDEEKALAVRSVSARRRTAIDLRVPPSRKTETKELLAERSETPGPHSQKSQKAQKSSWEHVTVFVTPLLPSGYINTEQTRKYRGLQSRLSGLQ